MHNFWINVSRYGEHLFQTRSQLMSEDQALSLYRLLERVFSKEDGFSVTLYITKTYSGIVPERE